MKRVFTLATILGIYLLSAPIAQADFVSIAPGAFHAGGSEDYGITYGSGFMYLNKPSSSGTLWAEVNLPNGAVIKNIRMLCWDQDTTYDIELRMYRINIYTGDYNEIFSIMTDGSMGMIRNMVDSSCSPAPSYRKVYNNALVYQLELNFENSGFGLRVYGITIEYEIP